jgi:hypothetical protein
MVAGPGAKRGVVIGIRLWSLHLSLLDARGLVALWREALLAQKVLQGKTAGYRSHPQLRRFREAAEPVAAVSAYLWAVHDEATRRGFAFDASKVARVGYAWTRRVQKRFARDSAAAMVRAVGIGVAGRPADPRPSPEDAGGG